MAPSLLSIIAHARSGALDRAWALFREAGFDGVEDDPAVLSVRGRLLKDAALAATGEERQKFYRDAAAAYAKAARIAGTTYPLINAATLSLLAGRPDDSRMLAQNVLAHAPDADETPYYQRATEAEAHLLLGQVDLATRKFDEAVALAPKAFEDHASTLRQFGLILDALGTSRAWLDRRRPPRALHFAGHIALAAETGALARDIRDVLAENNVGFGFGALAAGADILIAEALCERGAELHLVLPAPAGTFRAISVARYGNDWALRFDRLLDEAQSVRVTGGGPNPLSPPALQLSAEVAMGLAAMQAGTLASEAVQLLVANRDEPPGLMGSSGWIRALWARSGRRQILLDARRADRVATMQPAAPSDRLAAMLRIAFPQADAARLAEELLPRLADELASAAPTLVPPRWEGEGVTVAYETASRAAQAALAAVQAFAGIRIVGHYALARRVEDPFGGKPFLLGAAVTALDRLVAGTPAGAIAVSENFAAALHAGTTDNHPRTEFIGEDGPVEDALRLYALKP